ncbi:MAG TPA: acetyl-CoA C-acetyltransferase [Mycobacteriales bacterium]|nr:acetyl-CoA C-acetyltransferase [Mycobacteriales bacterium]
MSTGSDIVVCEPLRTPVGRYGGALQTVPAAELGAIVIAELLARTGVDPESVDDVILGQGYPNGEAPGIGRVAALDAGLPITVPGMQIDRRCGSGLQAVLLAAGQIRGGMAEIVLAGGAESMSQTEHYTLAMRWGAGGNSPVMHDRLARGRVTSGGVHHLVEGGMLETAENLRREFSIPREAQDQLAAESHRRAVAAQAEGRFKDELVPVTVRGRKGDTVVDADEHPRPGTTAESLAKLRPVMLKQDADSTVTAGNASGQNDGASLCLVTTLEKAHALGVRPYARLVSAAVAGVPPETMGIGPVPATEKALARAGLKLDEMDLIELNEAFAAQVLAVTGRWGLDALDPRLNVNGSGISLGHPIGATGVRILATMLRELERREGRYALETMCIGGGQGLAAVFERVT